MIYGPELTESIRPDCTCPTGDGSLRWPCPQHPPLDINVAMVQRKLGQRAKVGMTKYKVSTANAGLTHREWLIHLQQELMDACVYIEANLNTE